jgi:hypothetical protein
MTYDDRLRQTFDTLADRLREEVARRLADVRDQLASDADAERSDFAARLAEVKAQAEQDAADRLQQALAAAETDHLSRLRAAAAEAERRADQAQRDAFEAGRTEGFAAGRDEGFAAGRESGLGAGREEGFAAGRESGFGAGREEGFAAGRENGFAAGRDEGLAAGREQGLAAGRDQGFVAGRDQGFAAGRAEGFAAGREEGVRLGRHDGLQEGKEAGFREGRDAGLGEAKERALDAAARLSNCIRSIDRARSLSDVLDTLVGGAAREAGRSAVLLVDDQQLRGWSFVGFQGLPGTAAGPSGTLPATATGFIADALQSADAVQGRSGVAVAPAFAALSAGREMLAVPIQVGGQTVAVLYADDGVVEGGDPSLGWQAVVETIARHAARTLEAMTAFRAAQLLTREPVRGTTTRVQPAAAAEEDEGARRYAKLLVSEIKLYHEAAVTAGRRDRDLATRLGGEIARARALYDERVPPHVRQRNDHFHAELVRTLANGDATLLAN